MKGTVKWYDVTKGYGFIQGDDGVDVFAHHSGLSQEGFKRLRDGQKVEYDVEDAEKGPRAVNIRKEEKPTES